MPYFCIRNFFLSSGVAIGFSVRVAYQLLGEKRIVPVKLWPEAEVGESHESRFT